MEPNLQTVLAQLRDIRGLDPAPWWPPGIGWWLLLASLILTAVLIWQFIRWLQRDWRDDARRQLRVLQQQARKKATKMVLAECSELLRRIAVARHGRGACAGLFGEDWLNWLETRDPRHFKWSAQADLLLNLSYAPPETTIDPARLRLLLKAMKAWIEADLPTVHQENKFNLFSQWFSGLFKFRRISE